MQLLSDLKHNFSIIGLTETKINSKRPLININIPGYTCFSQPCLGNAGGSGFHVNNQSRFNLRDDSQYQPLTMKHCGLRFIAICNIILFVQLFIDIQVVILENSWVILIQQ